MMAFISFICVSIFLLIFVVAMISLLKSWKSDKLMSTFLMVTTLVLYYELIIP